MKKIYLTIFFALTSFAIHAQTKQDSLALKNTYIAFQKFYLKNSFKFNSFELYRGKTKGNNPPFYIDWKQVDKYFRFLRKSVPYVGETYIANEKKDFLEYEKHYKAEPTDEIAVGFDYDRWGGGQESPSYLVKGNINPKNKYEYRFKGDKADLIILPYYDKSTYQADESVRLMVPFVKEKGKWVIAGNIGYDE